MTEKKDILDIAQIDHIYATLLKMSVELDPDPLRHGPERLNQKTAAAQNMLSRLERILTQITHEHHIISRRYLVQEKDLDLQVKDLIANNLEVAGGSSYKDRQARAHMLLATELAELTRAEVALRDMEILTEVLKTKRSELKNLQQRLKDQFRICQEEIGLGARWRHPRASSLELEPGYSLPSFEDVESFKVLEVKVGAAVAEVNAAEKAQKSTPESVESLIANEGTGLQTSEVDTFLDALDVDVGTSPVAEDLDIDAYLDDEALM